MTDLYHLLVFIGRFQYLHHGHLAVIRSALRNGQHVLILVGSAFRPRTTLNPFTAPERAEMILACLTPEERARVTIRPLPDTRYNNPAWQRNVHHQARDVVQQIYPGLAGAGARIGLIGHSKDKSSYYLRLFPNWGSINVSNHEGISATDLRRLHLAEKVTAEAYEQLAVRMPGAALEWVDRFRNTPAFAELLLDQAKIDADVAKLSGGKYEIQRDAADLLLTHRGHVAMVARGKRPGIGLRCMPGGFVERNETREECAFREGFEEIGLDLRAAGAPRYSIVGTLDLDDPYRSQRGRIFSKVFHVELEPMDEFPVLVAGSDALPGSAMWLPYGELDSSDTFEDHYDAITQALRL